MRYVHGISEILHYVTLIWGIKQDVRISRQERGTSVVPKCFPGISDGVKGTWLLDATEEGISDDIALPVAPACGALVTPISTTMLQQHKSSTIRVNNVNRVRHNFPQVHWATKTN